MARCRCAGDICTCGIQAGSGVVIEGSGGFNDPYVISIPFPSLVTFTDSPDIDFTVSGAGTEDQPLVVTAEMKCLNCADTASGDVGDVLTLNGSGQWVPGPPNQVAPGAIAIGTGLSGDGTPGAPLRLDVCTYGELKALCAP